MSLTRVPFTDLVTFTRASEAWALDANGIWQKSLTNVPRYSWSTGKRAQLIEAQATNLVKDSATLETQNVTVTAVAHTLSFEGSGTVTLSGASSAGPLVGSSGRVSLTFTPTTGSLTLTVTGTVTNAQLETGSVATSYIPTTGTAATRAADLTSKDLSGYDFSTGITVSFEGNLGAVVDTYDRCLTVSDGTYDNVILLFYNKPGASLELAVKAGGVTQVSQSLGAGLGTDVKAAVSVSAAGDIVVVLDGTTKASVSGKTLPALNLLRIGRDPAGFNIPAVLHHYETLIKEGPSTEVALKALTA